MADVWTHGVWTTKPGCEDAFVAAWKALKPLGDAVGAGRPVLLQDRDRPNVFRSFGPFPDLSAIDRFRADLRPRLAAIQELLDGFEAYTLDEVPLDD